MGYAYRSYWVNFDSWAETSKNIDKNDFGDIEVKRYGKNSDFWCQ